MQEYDMAVVGILWGTAIAFALSAITMVDSGRKKLLIVLWAIAGAFLIGAIAWPSLAEKWPALRIAAETVAANKIAVNLVGIAIFCLLVLDFGFRSGWFGKARNGQGAGGVKGASEIAAFDAALQGLFERVGSLEQAPMPPRTEDHENLRTTVISALKEHLKLAEKVDNLQIDVTKNSAKLIQQERINLYTVDGTAQQLAHSLLFDSAPKLPDICSLRDLTPEIMTTDRHNAEEYWREIRNLLGSTRWGYGLRLTEQNAESTAEFAIRDIPIGERPANIDPMDLRRFAIVKFRAEETGQYIQRAKAAAQSTYRSCLDRLEEIKAEEKAAKGG